jgi:dTDP-4-amino-4,6-dideoxygalactose transaminase
LKQLIRNIPFSPPDITNAEIEEVTKAMKSGWIITELRTKLFEQKIAEYIGTSRTVALNSATAAMKLTLRILCIGASVQAITNAYTYTASVAAIDHVGTKVEFMDTALGSFEID